MVQKLLAFWEGLFSGPMLVLMSILFTFFTSAQVCVARFCHFQAALDSTLLKISQGDFNRKIYLTFSSRALAFSDSDVLNKEWQELPCCSPWPCLGHVQKDSRFYWKHRVQNTSKHFVDTSEIYLKLIHIHLFHMQMFKEQGEDRSFSGKHHLKDTRMSLVSLGIS